MTRMTGPADYKRVKLFEKAAEHVMFLPMSEIPFSEKSPATIRTLAFFEACFLNSLEGLHVPLKEAKALLLDRVCAAPSSPETKALVGTFDFILNQYRSPDWPICSRQFQDLLRACHRSVEQGNPADTPGTFKVVATRFGSTVFTKPAELEETLIQGYSEIASLAHPLTRAAMTLAVVTETSPFLHGSGKVAVLMMNRKLIAANLHPILIPPALRHFYLTALKCLSQKSDIEPLVKTLEYAQHLTASLPLKDFDHTLKALENSHALESGYNVNLKISKADSSLS